jgi:phosphate transport system substrate-binding protein
MVQFPAIIGGVVPVINVDGVKSGQIKLDGPTLADIFKGNITNWNDIFTRKYQSCPRAIPN